jgi:hypothetical protein
VGLALQPEEEALRSQLEALQNQLNAPAQFKVEFTVLDIKINVFWIVVFSNPEVRDSKFS